MLKSMTSSLKFYLLVIIVKMNRLTFCQLNKNAFSFYFILILYEHALVELIKTFIFAFSKTQIV